MTKLRAGVLGIGMMGRQHARVLSSLDGVEYVGAFDTRDDFSALFLERPVFNSLDDLLSQGLDYAVVSTPTDSHLDYAVRLAQEGVHLLVEKPIAGNLKSGLEIFRKISTSGVVAGVGHIERFNPAVREAKKRLEELGDIYQVTTRRQGPFPGRVKDVGVTKDLAIHDVDVTSWILGEPYSMVSARTFYRSNRNFEDMLVSTGQLYSGVITNHIVNWLSPRKERITTITGSLGSFQIDTISLNLTFYAHGLKRTNWQELAKFRGNMEGEVVSYVVDKQEPLLLEHENFRNVILGLSGEVVTLEEGVNSLIVCEAMLSSALSGAFERVTRLTEL